MDSKDGGPAFPTAGDSLAGDPTKWPNDGMSLRDWFAGHAPSHRVDFPSPEMAAAFAGLPTPDGNDATAVAALSAAIQAKLAYIYADAMLTERKRTP